MVSIAQPRASCLVTTKRIAACGNDCRHESSIAPVYVSIAYFNLYQYIHLYFFYMYFNNIFKSDL